MLDRGINRTSEKGIIALFLLSFFSPLCKRLFSVVSRLGYVTPIGDIRPYMDRAKPFTGPKDRDPERLQDPRTKRGPRTETKRIQAKRIRVF
jgi:hypothetical protein